MVVTGRWDGVSFIQILRFAVNRAGGQIIGAILLAVAPHLAAAEASTIVADRPGFSTGTYTVAPGSVNLEAGFEYGFDGASGTRSTQTLPLLNLRTGLTPNAELNLLWDGWNIEDDREGSSESSPADLSIGAKYRLYTREGLNLTLLGLVSLPVGSPPSTSDSTDPLLGLLWDAALSEEVELFGVALASAVKVDTRREYDTQLAIGAAFTHSMRLGTFVEIFAVLPSDARDEEVVIDAGVTYLLHENLQIDFYVGAGLNDASANFIGFGVARRF